jgi:hypothetical protein
MTRDTWNHLSLSAIIVVGAAVWAPAPLHAADTHGARTTEAGRRTRQEKAEPSPDALRAQAEKDRLEKERLEKQRQEAEKARAEALRRRGAQGGPPGAGARPGAPKPPVPGQAVNGRTLEERREIAKKAAHFESSYRSRTARINRLIGIYKAKGDEAHVAQLERLREKLGVRREHAMEGFRKDLGETGFKSVQGQVNGGGRRALEERAKEKPKDKEEAPKDKAPGVPGGGR